MCPLRGGSIAVLAHYRSNSPTRSTPLFRMTAIREPPVHSGDNDVTRGEDMNPGGCAEPPGFLRVYGLRCLGNSQTRDDRIDDRVTL